MPPETSRYEKITRAAAGTFELNCPVGDHLIRIHVGLSPRARLPNLKGKMRVQRPIDHLQNLLREVGRNA